MRSLSLALSALLLAACSSTGEAPVIADVRGAEAVAAMTTDGALAELKAGNLRFVTGSELQRNWKAQAEASVDGASPYAAVLTSTDARVPVLRAFDGGIGDLVTVRTPGPVLSGEAIAALEASVRSGVRAVVVLTHSDEAEICAACGEERTGAARGVEDSIQASIDATPTKAEDRVAMDRAFEGLDFADAVAMQHARVVLDSLRAASSDIRAAEEAGSVTLVAAYYDLGSGAVVWLP